MTPASAPVVIPDAVRDLAQLVQIQAVRLAHVQCETKQAGPGDKLGPLEIRVHVGAQRGPEPDALYAYVRIEVVPASKADPKRKLAQIRCDYVVHYRLPAERLKVLSQQDAELFAGFNGLYNAWPYARELVQTMTAKMMLPPVVLPIYRPGMFGPPADWTEDKPAQSGATATPS